MSVGAGSIKRAAKAADTAGTAGSRANEEMAVKSETIQKETNKPAGKAGGKLKPKETKAVDSKSVKTRTADKSKAKGATIPVPAVAESALKDNAAAKKASKAAETSASGAAGKYEAYGIGQELPVYLM